MNQNNIVKIGAAYVRVSTDDQLDYSPESQLDEIKLYAIRNNINLQDQFIFMEKEGVSGKKADSREEFQRMIAIAKIKPKPFDVILVWKFSRFARNQDESTFYKGTLRKNLGIDIISVSEPIMEGMYGRLIEMIIEWQDEFYSYNLSMEVKRGMKKRAEKGLYNSTAPFGYDKVKDGIPTVNELESYLVKKIFHMYANGYDQNHIVRFLNEKKYRTKRDRLFTSEGLEYILENPFYIGKVRWNRRVSSITSGKKLKDKSEWIIADSHHEPIIDMDTWNIVQEKKELIKTTYERYSHPISHTKHWLSGLVKCSICGKSLSFKFDKTGACNTFQCLGYRTGIHNESQSISEKKLVAAVLESLEEVLFDGNAEFELITLPHNDNQLAKKLYQDELTKLEFRERRVKQAYLDGIDSLQEYKNNKTLISNRSSELTEQINNLNLHTTPNSSWDDSLHETVHNVLEVIKSEAENHIKATALRSIVRKIIFHKDSKELEFQYYLNKK